MCLVATVPQFTTPPQSYPLIPFKQWFPVVGEGPASTLPTHITALGESRDPHGERICIPSRALALEAPKHHLLVSGASVSLPQTAMRKERKRKALTFADT